MQITWNTDVNAPCCPGEILADDGRSVLVQIDWDFPGVAQTFGWNLRSVQRETCDQCGEEMSWSIGVDGAACHGLCPECGDDEPCDHDGTDGTIDCPACGMSATAFISAACDWLDDNDGATAEDPGYFD